MDNWAHRHKAKWTQGGRTAYSRVPVGGQLWELKACRLAVPSDAERAAVSRLATVLVGEVKAVLEAAGIRVVEISVTGSTNPRVLTFVSGAHDYDVHIIVAREDVPRARAAIMRAFPGGVAQAVIRDEERAVVPYVVRRTIQVDGKAETVPVDYGIIHPEHERYATVGHARVLGDKLAAKPHLRDDIVITKQAVKEGRIDIRHQGLTSAAVSFGIVRAGGAVPWARGLAASFGRWRATRREEDWPNEPDPCLKGRNLLGNIPRQAPVVERIIRGLESMAGGRGFVPYEKHVARYVRLDICALPPNRLPQDTIAQVKRMTKAAWNEERIRVLGAATQEQPFVTAEGGRVVAYVPPIASLPRRKVYLPLDKISRDRIAEAITEFKAAHGGCQVDGVGYYYIAEPTAPDYRRIRERAAESLRA